MRRITACRIASTHTTLRGWQSPDNTDDNREDIDFSNMALLLELSNVHVPAELRVVCSHILDVSFISFSLEQSGTSQPIRSQSTQSLNPTTGRHHDKRSTMPTIVSESAVQEHEARTPPPQEVLVAPASAPSPNHIVRTTASASNLTVAPVGDVELAASVQLDDQTPTRRSSLRSSRLLSPEQGDIVELAQRSARLRQTSFGSMGSDEQLAKKESSKVEFDLQSLSSLSTSQSRIQTAPSKSAPGSHMASNEDLARREQNDFEMADFVSPDRGLNPFGPSTRHKRVGSESSQVSLGFCPTCHAPYYKVKKYCVQCGGRITFGPEAGSLSSSMSISTSWDSSSIVGHPTNVLSASSAPLKSSNLQIGASTESSNSTTLVVGTPPRTHAVASELPVMEYMTVEKAVRLPPNTPFNLKVKVRVRTKINFIVLTLYFSFHESDSEAHHHGLFQRRRCSQ